MFTLQAGLERLEEEPPSVDGACHRVPLERSFINRERKVTGNPPLRYRECRDILRAFYREAQARRAKPS